MKQLYLEGRKHVKAETSGWMKLEYYLTQEHNEEWTDATVYGMSIVKKTHHLIEMEETGGLSNSKEMVLSMLHKLIACTVTPMVLLEVVDDLATEKLCS